MDMTRGDAIPAYHFFVLSFMKFCSNLIVIYLVIRLLDQDCALLYLIGQKKSCEVVIGQNGR